MAVCGSSAFRHGHLGALIVIGMLTARCSLFVDAAGIAGDAKEGGGVVDAENADHASADNDAAADADAADIDARADATSTDATTTDATTTDATSRPDATPADGGMDAASVPDGAYFWPGNGHAYFVVTHDGGVAYDTAKQEAAALGGHLATIGSAAENQFVSDLANNTDRAWDKTGGPFLGGYQPLGSPEPDGGWTWVTGEPWAYSAWAPSEPTGGFQEDYVQFEARFSAQWNDVASGATNSFVVEFE